MTPGPGCPSWAHALGGAEENGEGGNSSGVGAYQGPMGSFLKKSMSTPSLQNLLTSPPLGFLRAAPMLSTYETLADTDEEEDEDEDSLGVMP